MANGAEDIGGDGSDSDLQDIADEAAAAAIGDMYGQCSNEGMNALADMIAEAIQGIADDMANKRAPDMQPMFDAIADVHSADTAASCMSEAIATAFEDLMDGWDEILAHEAEEGAGGF